MNNSKPNLQASHIGIIPDGGRRWALRNNTPYLDAYRIAFSRLYYVLSRVYDFGFKEATIFILSWDNLGRNAEDLAAVYAALPDLRLALVRLCAHGSCDRVRAIGAILALPEETQNVVTEISNLQGTEGSLLVNLLIAYSPWHEIAQAVKKKGPDFTIQDLWLTTNVDVVLRTGGGALLSGFPPLQAQYAHLLTTEEMFDELSETDLDRLLLKASKVTHRFGK